MVRATWGELTAGLDESDLALLSAYRERVGALPDVEERVHRTEIQFARDRIFTSGFMKSHRLEIVVDLLRHAEHPRLLAAFNTTQKVVTHRLTLVSVDDIDSVMDLIREGWETVGPGT